MRLPVKQFKQLVREALNESQSGWGQFDDQGHSDWLAHNVKKGDQLGCPECGASYKYGIDTWCQDCGLGFDEKSHTKLTGSKQDYNARNPKTSIP